MEKTDGRELILKHETGWGNPVVYTVLTQLDLLRMMRCFKNTSNEKYYKLFKTIIEKIDLLKNENTDFNRDFPRKSNSSQQVEEKWIQR